MQEKIVIGITGSFGSGKTTVAKMFKRLGAKIVDADRIAHQLIRPQTRIYRKIIDVFGDGIIAKQRNIDRKKLAKIVFNDRNLLQRLNKIVHPEIIKSIKKEIKRIPKGVIVLDAPLLIEAGLKSIVDKIIVVNINSKIQMQRLLKKTASERDDIIKRIRAQVPLSVKIRQADFVIDNSGKINQTEKQIKKIWRLLWRN
ncbi:MAG: dephospho-CoA kinase [Candidatus Omnitrophica bacterium]|nr:dephospho-CoA kinase [Candidatus Omnitrophota bacterium]